MIISIREQAGGMTVLLGYQRTAGITLPCEVTSLISFLLGVLPVSCLGALSYLFFPFLSSLLDPDYLALTEGLDPLEVCRLIGRIKFHSSSCGRPV